MKSIHELLEVALKRRASDLVLKAGAPPALRVDGRMETSEFDPLTAADTREFAYSIIYSSSRDHLLHCEDADPLDTDSKVVDAERCMEELQERSELDLVFTIPKLARIRANLFLQRGTVGAALRIIPLRPYTVD